MNKVECLDCGDILTSVHVHDAKGCSCWYEWQEILYGVPKVIEDTKWYESVRKQSRGIWIDGGDEYLHYAFGTKAKYRWLNK